MAVRRHRHSLSHYRLTSFNMGQLVPLCCLEVLPGDSFRHRVEALVRVAPLVAPVMHPCELKVQSWFVPSRLCWSGWENFITGQSLTPPPTVTPLLGTGTLSDHLQANGALTAVNALPFAAYNLIWNHFYRDQDLQTPLNILTNVTLQNVCWAKDVYTTARVAPQQGLAGRVSMRGLWASTAAAAPQPVAPQTGAPSPTSWVLSGEGAANTSVVAPYFNLEDFRVGMATQKIRENRNKYGSRYTDYLRFLGVRPSDSRLQLPELLGTDAVTISFSEVLQTAPVSTPATFVGDMAGHGIAAIRTRPYKRFFEEHGYLLTLGFVRPKSIFSLGRAKMFDKAVQGDYWQKEDEMLGDQPIFNREMFATGGTPAGVFGYTDRHYDYRGIPSAVVSSFRGAPDDVWHLARTFSASPVLNSAFVSCTPPNRPFADTAEMQLRLMVGHQIQARRLVSAESRV